jgi:hypothetical protein
MLAAKKRPILTALKEGKTLAELEALAVMHIRKVPGCGHVAGVKIRPLPQSGEGANWTLSETLPTLPESSRLSAQLAVASLATQYDLVDTAARRTSL